jgi:hypothetical protein
LAIATASCLNCRLWIVRAMVAALPWSALSPTGWAPTIRGEPQNLRALGVFAVKLCFDRIVQGMFPKPEHFAKRRQYEEQWCKELRPLSSFPHNVALNFMHYNYCRIHQTLRITPAMQAGLTDHVWEIEELLALLD